MIKRDKSKSTSVTTRDLEKIFFSLSITAAAFFVFFRHADLPHALIFINESSDHRFDESIQVSIISAQRRTGVQNAVVITDRFKSAEMSAEAAKIFDRWGLGRASNGRAILYLYSPAAHDLKIEVGHALEGVLPDVQVHFLERAAKSFTFADRAQDFWAELINTINIRVQSQSKDLGDFQNFRFLSGGAGVDAHDYSVDSRQKALEMRKPNERAKLYEPDANLEITLKKYFQSLSDGVGAEDLPLLSSRSKVFRSFTPMTSYQTKRNADMMERAGIAKILKEENWAFVFFKKADPVLPLVFQKIDGLWFVEEPLSWSLFQRFEDSNDVFLKYPLKFAQAENNTWLLAHFGQTLYPDPQLQVDQLQAMRDWRADYFLLYWLEKVSQNFRDPPEKIAEEKLWVSIDVAQNLGNFSRYLELMTEATRRHSRK